MVLFCFLVLNFEIFICFKSIFIRNHFVFYSIDGAVFLIYLPIISRNSGVKYSFFIIWFSRMLIIFFFYDLLHNSVPYGHLKRTISSSRDESMPVTSVFDLKGTISSLCSSARRRVIKIDLVLVERKLCLGWVIPEKHFVGCSKHLFYLCLIVLSPNLAALLTTATWALLFPVALSPAHFCALLSIMVLYFYKYNPNLEKHFVSCLILDSSFQ